jgi:hypothetical protein
MIGSREEAGSKLPSDSLTRSARLTEPAAGAYDDHSPVAPALERQPAPSAGASSDRMSMRQPVSRAASRAFCPSFPMASDSW